jgi:NDP-sugar pyrophosphorylase family protein
MKVLILAGGQGTRLTPHTTTMPKPLVPVGDLPILEIIIRQLKYFRFESVTLAVGHLASQLKAYFGDGEKCGVKIAYSYESVPLGTAGPIALVNDLSDPFLVMNGDILTSLDYTHIVEFHRRAGGVATIACCQKEVRINLGVLETNEEDRLVDYLEKPVLTYSVSMGVYVFSRRVLSYLQEGEHVDLPDLMKRLIRNERAVSLYRFDGYWRDIGTVEDYEQANREFALVRDSLHLGT